MNKVTVESVTSADPTTSEPQEGPENKKTKIRNYSFLESKRLPADKMTEVNGVKVPAIPGSNYHAIICALAANKGTIVRWDKLEGETQKYMRIYGGDEAWEKFINRKGKKSWQQRIKENTHTLTRSGKDCYGRRLHERGMTIYFFKDGAMLITGGQIITTESGYNVKFEDGRELQIRHRGRTMSYNEHLVFLNRGWIDKSCKILNAEEIKKYRSQIKQGKTQNT